MQRRPNGKATRSPTESLESFQQRAFREYTILMQQHVTHPPTHTAVVKFKKPVSINEQKSLQTRLRQNLANESKRSGFEFAVYYIREIEPTNCVHYHFLVRTSQPDAGVALGRIIQISSSGLAQLSYFRPVKNVEAITRYVTKNLKSVRNGEKPHLLFRKNSEFISRDGGTATSRRRRKNTGKNGSE